MLLVLLFCFLQAVVKVNRLGEKNSYYSLLCEIRGLDRVLSRQFSGTWISDSELWLLILSSLPFYSASIFLLSDLQVNVMESFYCNANSLSFRFQLISTTQTGYSSHLGKKNHFKRWQTLLSCSPQTKFWSSIWLCRAIQSILMQRFSKKAGNSQGEGFQASAVSFPDPLC